MDINKMLKEAILDAVDSIRKEGVDIDYLRLTWCDEEGYKFIMGYGAKNEEKLIDLYEDLDNE